MEDELDKRGDNLMDDAYLEDDYDRLGADDSDSQSYDNENSNYNYNDLLNRKSDESKDIKSKYLSILTIIL